MSLNFFEEFISKQLSIGSFFRALFFNLLIVSKDVKAK